MERKFRLYHNGTTEFESSIFDVIGGDDETKQTKGLAYILYSDEHLFKSFYHTVLAKSSDLFNDKDYSWKNILSYDVIAEGITSNRKRADILIKILFKNDLKLAIIIEAKSIKKSVKIEDVDTQLDQYMLDGSIKGLDSYNKVGVTLTKYKHITNESINISWSDVISIISTSVYKNGDHSLTKQFFKFLTGINKEMNYYEKEVLSVPASKTYNEIEKYHIYTRSEESVKFKKAIFMAFREPGGIMRKLYKVEDVLIINPHDLLAMNRIQESMSPDIAERIVNYSNEIEFGNNNHRYYILSIDENIELPHAPKTKTVVQGHAYYTLSEILSKNEVTPASAD